MKSPDFPAIPYNLKHFLRGPLRFSELSQRLILRIVKKHAASTQLKLLEASFSVSILVEIVHSEIPPIQMARNFLETFPKNELMEPYEIAGCFPFSERVFFKDWAKACLVCFTGSSHIEGIEFEELYHQPPYSYENEYKRSAEEFWRVQQSYGPSSINVNYFPRNIKQKFILKTSLIAAFRLSITSHIATEAVWNCFRSVRLTEILYQIELTNPFPPFSKDKGHIYYVMSVWAAPLGLTCKKDGYPPTVNSKAAHDASQRRALFLRKWMEDKKKMREYRAPFRYTKFINPGRFL